MVKVLIASRISEVAINKLREAGFELIIREEPSEEELMKLVKDVDAIIVRSKPLVSRRVIENARNLKLIARAGVGLDNIDLDAAREKGVSVINSPESVTWSVAELTIGLMLALARKIAFSDRMVRKGSWVKKEAVGYELFGKTLGIIGFGRIGRAVAKIAKNGFNMKILYYDATRPSKEVEEELGAEYRDLDTLLRESDIVSIHVPLTTETKHLINRDKLRLMKRNALLINTARGGVLDTDALIQALREGRIAGAALDVFEDEPLPHDHPLTKLDNVVLTPHIGASTHEAQERAGYDIAVKLIEFFSKK